MNKKIIFTILFALVAVMAHAQEICKAEPNADDYVKLLNAQGYHVFALDVSKLEKNKYLMTPVIQVWTDGKLETNMLEDLWLGFTNESPKITVGLMPKNDTLFACKFQFDDVCGFGMSLPMRPVKNEAEGYEQISYNARPFAIEPAWKENEVIPIAAYSSSWYDPEEQIFRNCDSTEFDASYQRSATFKLSPHIYVFGITIRKM